MQSCIRRFTTGTGGKARLLAILALAMSVGNTCAPTSAPVIPALEPADTAGEQVLGYRPALPGAPTDLTVQASLSGPIELSWTDNSTTETGFLIRRSQAGGDEWMDYASVSPDLSVFVDSEVEGGQTYCYRVVAVSATGAEWSSGTECAQALYPEAIEPGEADLAPAESSDKPARPSSFQVAASPDGGIELAWLDNATNEDGFQIERYTSATGWEPRETVGPDVSTFYDHTVEAGKSYCYRVAAFNALGNSGFARLKCASISSKSEDDGSESERAPAKPSRLSVEAVPGVVELSWQDNSGNEEGFRIERYSKGTWTEQATVAADVTSYSDETAAPGASVCYRVSAFNAVGQSRSSLMDCASPIAGEKSKDPTADEPCPDGDCPPEPANKYEAAGIARRAAGIESWMFVHPTWINWHPQKYTGPLAKELLDGFLLIMLDFDGARSFDGASAAAWIRQAGMGLVAGMRLGPDKQYAEWTDPGTWLKDLGLYSSIQQDLQLETGSPLALDMEPYWDEQPRYPRSEIQAQTASAMGEWVDIARRTELWVYPGGEQYFNVWTLAQARATRGPVYMLDSSTYTRRDGDNAALEARIRERQAFMQAHGMEYMPGFYLRHAMDPGLYELLQRCGVRRCWFFCQADSDDYRNFGTPEWLHAR